MKSSDNAVEMRLLIVLGDETADIAMLSFQLRLTLQLLLREGQLQLYLTQ